MAKLPLPPEPETLAQLGSEVRSIPAGTLLTRVYFAGGAYPSAWNTFRHYGPLRGRFDHHLPPPRMQERGIMYLAPAALTCVAEAFQAKRRIDTTSNQPMLVVFSLAHAIAVLDLTGLWPTRAGASAAIHSGPRPRSQVWARAIYAAFPDLQGMLYCSSMNANAPCLALFERARQALPTLPQLNEPLSTPLLRAVLLRFATRLRYRIL